MDDLKLYAKTHKDLEELIAVTHSFSADICMEFGIEKCATLKMEKGKKREGIGVTLPTGEVLKDLAEEGYRYLGILESDVIHHKEMKKLVAAEYYRRVKKVVKSGLHGKHTFQAINTWAVPVARYGAGCTLLGRNHQLDPSRAEGYGRKDKEAPEPAQSSSHPRGCRQTLCKPPAGR